MVIDVLTNASKYTSLHPRFAAAFHYLQTTDLAILATRRYEIEGDEVFAIVQEYETVNAAQEQMESHRKYIDIQYVISGSELVGLSILYNQTVSKEYSDAEDFMLYADKPMFFAPLSAGMFMIYFPTDLHMPCIQLMVLPL